MKTIKAILWLLTKVTTWWHDEPLTEERRKTIEEHRAMKARASRF